MTRVKVWRYKVFFNHHGAIDSGRFATEGAILALGGERIDGKEALVDERMLDELGRAPEGFEPEPDDVH